MHGILAKMDNRLLGALPADAVERLRPHLERVELARGDRLHGAGEAERFVYFPIDCVVSLFCVIENGASAEMSVVGNEGMLGVAVFMGDGRSMSQAVTIAPGYAYRLAGQHLSREVSRGDDLCRLLLRYLQALFSQIAQTAVCNRHHTIDQQLCRWLLQMLDRLPGNEVAMTQEMIASMLGVRREGVTEAARKLQLRGAISYRRGRITVLDRSKLERQSCECHAVVKAEEDRLLSTTRPISRATAARVVRRSTSRVTAALAG